MSTSPWSRSRGPGSTSWPAGWPTRDQRDGHEEDRAHAVVLEQDSGRGAGRAPRWRRRCADQSAMDRVRPRRPPEGGDQRQRGGGGHAGGPGRRGRGGAEADQHLGSTAPTPAARHASAARADAERASMPLAPVAVAEGAEPEHRCGEPERATATRLSAWLCRARRGAVADVGQGDVGHAAGVGPPRPARGIVVRSPLAALAGAPPGGVNAHACTPRSRPQCRPLRWRSVRRASFDAEHGARCGSPGNCPPGPARAEWPSVAPWTSLVSAGVGA